MSTPPPGSLPPDYVPASTTPPPAFAVAPAAMAAPLGRTDTQVLIGLRVALAVAILLSLGSLALNALNFSRYGFAVSLQLILRTMFGLLPPAAVLIAVSVRTPPAGMALDAAAGLGIASILFRFGMLGVTGFFLRGYGQQLTDLSVMLLWMVTFSLLEVAIAAMALYLRGRLGRLNVAAVIVATLAFLVYDGAVQAAMQLLIALVY